MKYSGTKEALKSAFVGISVNINAVRGDGPLACAHLRRFRCSPFRCVIPHRSHRAHRSHRHLHCAARPRYYDAGVRTHSVLFLKTDFSECSEEEVNAACTKV